MKTCIISECGINSSGDLGLAKQQIDLSVAAGADVVKFQIYNSEKLHGVNSPVYKDAKRGEFSEKNLRVLADYSPIEWMATPFDNDAVDLLEDIGVGRYKVASCSMTNWALLTRIQKTKKPVIMSTGRHDTAAIRKAVDILGSDNLILLYCVPS